MPRLVEAIREKLRGTRLVNLATVDPQGRPWVRPVMARTDDDLTMRIVTFLSSRKVAHIRHNPEVHVSFATSGLAEQSDYLQIQALATVSTALAERSRMWEDRLSRYFHGSDDPEFAVVILRPYRIELYGSSSRAPAVWEAPRDAEEASAQGAQG